MQIILSHFLWIISSFKTKVNWLGKNNRVFWKTRTHSPFLPSGKRHNSQCPYLVEMSLIPAESINLVKIFHLENKLLHPLDVGWATGGGDVLYFKRSTYLELCSLCYCFVRKSSWHSGKTGVFSFHYAAQNIPFVLQSDLFHWRFSICATVWNCTDYCD